MILDIEKHAKKYIEFVKSKQYCTACFTRGDVDADHLRTVGMGNNRKNPSKRDFTCIPLCRKHHTERGAIGKDEFNRKHNIDVWEDAHYLLMEYICKE